MRRRRYTIYDEEAESQDELITNNQNEEGEEFWDFRNYPLYINWKDMDSIHYDSYEIKEDFGFFGVSIYCKIQNDNLLLKKMNIIPHNFDKNIMKFYFDQYEISSADSIGLLTKLIETLPNNKDIRELINKKLLQKKEQFLIKLILDLKLHFLSNFDKLNLKALKRLVNIMRKFYIFISNEDLRKIYENINKDKILKEIYENYFLINFNKKSEYINQIKKLKNENNDLLLGISYEKFKM